MKREKGFSMIELMVSMGIVVTVVGIATAALMQAQQTTQGVAYEANTQENLRAGMHFIVRDLMQAGEGIPQGGISVPNNGATSTIFRPGAFAPSPTTFPNPAPILPNFPGGFLAMTAIGPGSVIGQDAKSVDPKSGAILDGLLKTDIINILYADNSLVDAAGNFLYSFPIIQGSPAVPACNNASSGSIALQSAVFSPSGFSVTLDPLCFTMPGVTNPITVGNLIMFHNQNGTALEYVTNVAGQIITFGTGDPAGLNQTGRANGTVVNLQNTAGGIPTGGFPPTTITRVWMVSYYVDSTTNPSHPQLVRQVNYPGFPSVLAAVNPPQPIADNIENLTFSYVVNLPGAAYPSAGNAPTTLPPDSPNQIRAVNVSLAGRSEFPFKSGSSSQFFRNNLSTQVSIRSLSFQNQFGTSATYTAP
jgi:prepilin-type N-terminal cleavage/methylation domain-containing protein